MAAASLGRLTLDLVARIGNFTGPMSQAERQARNSSESIASSFNVASVAAKAFGAVVAGASVAGVAAFVNQTITAGNEIKKFSQLANSSMGQFQYYAKGAEIAGISMESFADKMKDMQDRIGDFQQTGGGPLADFFTNIAPLVGVTIQQFQKLSGPEAMQLYYDSLVKVGASQNDMKFYMEAIISDSSLLIPLLENGGAGFKKWGDAAQSAGAIMSDSMVSQLALAKENLQMLDLQWQGFQATLVNNVMPVVQSVSDNFDTIKAVAMALGAAIATKLVIQMGMLSIEFIKGIIEGVRYQMTLAAMAGQTITLTTATAGLRTAMLGLVGGTGGLAVLAIQALAAGAAFLYMRNSSDDAKGALFDQIESVEELTKKYSELNSEQRQFEASKLREKIEEEAHAIDLATNKYVALAIAKEGAWNTDQVSAFNKLVQDVTKNGVETNTAFLNIKNTGLFSQKDLDSIAKLNTGFGDSNSKLKEHQSLLKTLESKNADIAKSHDKITSSVNAQAQAYLSLTQKQRDALNEINGNLSRENYIQANMKAGWSREQAEYTADYRNKAGLGYTGKSLSKIEMDAVNNGYALTKQTEARAEAEKKIEDSKKKQADEAKKQVEIAAKQYNYSKQELSMLQRVAAISAKYDLNSVGSKYGIPENLLASVMAQESKGNINAKSQTGAIGPFQTTGIYRKQYGMSVADSYDVRKAAEAAAKDLSKSYKEFGNWADAITAYNAGINGTKNLKAKGFTQSASKTKEAKEYSDLVNKWFVGLNGSNKKDSGFIHGTDTVEALKDYQEYQDEMERMAKELATSQLDIRKKYFDEEERLAFENSESIKEINEAYALDDTARNKYLKLQQLSYKKDVAEFKKSLLQKQFDLANTQQAMAEQIRNLSGGADEIFAQATMSPADYDRWSIENNRSNAKADLKNQRVGVEQDIMTSDLYSTDDDRYEALLEAHQEYRDGMAAIDVDYNQQVKDLEFQQYESTMQMYGSLLSRAGTVWGDMTQMVKDSAGESSAAYKVMFLAQQAIAIAQGVVNTELAATGVMNDPSALTMAQKLMYAGMIRATGYTSVGLIAAQTISGMAHDGIDNIPKEGTWLLDKGERVVDSRTNSDLKNYLANGGGSGGDVYYTQTIHIASDGSATSESDAKQLGKMMENMTLSVIRREQRQGGLLSK